MLEKLDLIGRGLESSASVMTSCSQLSPGLLAVALLASAPHPSPLVALSLLRALLLPVPDKAPGSSLLTCLAAMGLVSSDACSLTSLAGPHNSKSSCMETPSGQAGSWWPGLPLDPPLELECVVDEGQPDWRGAFAAEPEREARAPEQVLSEDWQLLLVGVWDDEEGGRSRCRAEPGSGMGGYAFSSFETCASTSGRCWARAAARLLNPADTSLQNNFYGQHP